MEHRKTKEQNKIYTFVVCFLLDNLGYNDIPRFRESAYVKQADILSQFVSQIDTILQTRDYSIRVIATGSKVEGACLPLQGDFDFMLIYENILCAEKSYKIPNFNTLKPIYSENVPPGYVRVAKVHMDATSEIRGLCSNSYLNLTPDGLPYISSTVFHNFQKQLSAAFPLARYDFVGSEKFSYSGPACTRTMQTNFSPGLDICVDHVQTIYFYSPIYLPRWAARTRHYCWPSSDVINEISSMEGYIVPVGSIEGENTDLDWKISYVTAENKLISNLNTIQFKLYVIMKMIAKEFIYPDFPVISSYVVKNTVLWVCELNSRSLFTADLLFDQIRKCLLFVQTCLKNNHLPNYIIPERNLIAFRMNVLSKKRLILRVENLLDDGLAIFSRLTIFQKHSPLALVLAPSSVYFFGKTRDKVEKLYLLLSIKRSEHITLDDLTRSSAASDIEFKCNQDESYHYLSLELFSVLFPKTSILEMLSSHDIEQIFDIYFARLKLFLS